MMTLRQLSKQPKLIPSSTSWYLADVGEGRGKQELFTKQVPQRLKALREHALIESAVSSNRIEGVEVDTKRVGTVIFGKQLLHDRDEEEVRGYRNALQMIHTDAEAMAFSERTILELHRLARSGVWDAGKYKEKDSDIMERYADGRSRVRFKTVSAAKTPDAMKQLVSLWRDGLRDRWCHPLILLAASNLDFLCIHPFRDGNGRVSRLLMLLQTYYLGYEVGRYISLERLIEQDKERYYEVLELSSARWHEGRHDPWPYLNFVLSIVKRAYGEFEKRVGQTTSPRGSKTELVIEAIGRQASAFKISDIQRECPGVGIDLIRKVLKGLRTEGKVECLGRGLNAEWKRKGRAQ